MKGKLSVLLGGRRSLDAPPGDPVPPAPPVAAVCSRPGCAAAESWRCEYRDGAGRECGWWCRDHIRFVEGRAWCERHANTLRELSARRDTIYEIKTIATLEDRSPSLCSMIVEEIDVHVRAALEQIYAHPGIRVVTDPAVREVRVAREIIYGGPDGLTVEQPGYDRAWERGWGVVAPQGYRTRVMVRVTTTEPPSVQILVNGHHVLEGVPDWIALRSAGQAPTDAERRTYHDRVAEAIINELTHPR
jgi:hypothetical protein